MEMTFADAVTLIHHEHEADDGLLTLFRLSEDVEPERVGAFLGALKCVADYYSGRTEIDKQIAYEVFSFYQVLTASAAHWKASRPDGMAIDVTTALILALNNVFSSSAADP